MSQHYQSPQRQQTASQQQSPGQQSSARSQSGTQTTDGFGGTGGQSGTQQAGQGQQPMFYTENFLPAELRSTSCAALNDVLADLVVVQSQLYSAHWNVRGEEFYQLHELFEDLADELEPHADEIAERVTALGGVARGTVYEAAQHSTIPAMPPDCTDGATLLQCLAEHLSALDATLYQHLQTVDDQGDLDTADLLNEVSRDVSKALWFVEAHLQPSGQSQMGRGQQAIGGQ